MQIFSSYSIKGGVGKTALAVNLACHLRERGWRTLLVDLDPQAAATFYFRVDPVPPDQRDVPEIFTDEWAVHNVRESNYPGLDILPSGLDSRHFDLWLAARKKPRKQVRRFLEDLSGGYGAVVLDCPPGLTMLAENIFRASDAIVVPVIPTPLSGRTLEQLVAFLAAEQLDATGLMPFFSMVQGSKRLHGEMQAGLREQFPGFLQTEIPFSVDVEAMGIHREPLVVWGKSRPAAQAFRDLCDEILNRLPSRR
jgi:chromosome partitioning protein